jgi:hypothetical protein
MELEMILIEIHPIYDPSIRKQLTLNHFEMPEFILPRLKNQIDPKVLINPDPMQP